MTRKVFLSHTSELRTHPEKRSFYDQAEQAVISLGHAVIGQPHFAAEPTPPPAVCARRIAEADYVVFIVGFLWGTPISEDPNTSYTMFEYERATDKPRFVFLIGRRNQDYPFDLLVDEDGDNKERQGRFRDRLLEDGQVVSTVHSAEALNHAVYKAINDWEGRHPDGRGGAESDLQPPFADIALSLRRGRVIPFLGPDAGLPPDYDPPDTEPRPDPAALATRFQGRVPSDLELSLFLAHYSQYPPGEPLSLPNVASFYSATTPDPANIPDRLREAYAGDRAPRPIHRYLASLDTNLLIFVSGFDDLMEQALREAGRPFTTVLQCAERSKTDKVVVLSHDDPDPRYELAKQVDLDPERKCVVYKPHGSFVRVKEGFDQFVATEDCNIEVLGGLASNSVPEALSDAVLAKRFLFLGLGLESWTARSLLSRIKAGRNANERSVPKVVNQHPAWAIHRNPSALERRLWGTLDTEVYDMDLDRFAAGLEAAQ